MKLGHFDDKAREYVITTPFIDSQHDVALRQRSSERENPS
jgi:hypothetical protein